MSGQPPTINAGEQMAKNGPSRDEICQLVADRGAPPGAPVVTPLGAFRADLVCPELFE
jgi:hypothetical protein